MPCPGPWAALAAILFLDSLGGSLGHAQTPETASEPADPAIAILIFPRQGADEDVAGEIERSLRLMYTFYGETRPGFPKVHPVELRFDAGHLTKSDIVRSRRHFNQGQRELERNEGEEAADQLFRARRFYNKAIPYASDRELLGGIYYYEYLANRLAGESTKGREAYCRYVALIRNLKGGEGPFEEQQALQKICGETKSSGTGVLRVKANRDGAHIYVDGRLVGGVGRSQVYEDQNLPAGPHLIEVRKAGYVRWGTLANIKQGSFRTLSARLKPARAEVMDVDYNPLRDVRIDGDEAQSEEYINEVMFQATERFQVQELLLGYLTPKNEGHTLTVLFFREGVLLAKNQDVEVGESGIRTALSTLWKSQFGVPLDPVEAKPFSGRIGPALFKVD